MVATSCRSPRVAGCVGPATRSRATGSSGAGRATAPRRRRARPATRRPDWRNVHRRDRDCSGGDPAPPPRRSRRRRRLDRDPGTPWTFSRMTSVPPGRAGYRAAFPGRGTLLAAPRRLLSDAPRTAPCPGGPRCCPPRRRSRDRRTSRSSAPGGPARRPARRPDRTRRASASGSPDVGPTAITPSTVRPAPTARSTSAGTSATGQPPLPVSAVASTCTRMRAPGARRAISSTMRGRSTLSHSATRPARWRTLFVCNRPMKCTSTPAAATASRLVSSSWA